jgi:hypothetical protein
VTWADASGAFAVGFKMSSFFVNAIDQMCSVRLSIWSRQAKDLIGMILSGAAPATPSSPDPPLADSFQFHRTLIGDHWCDEVKAWRFCRIIGAFGSSSRGLRAPSHGCQTLAPEISGCS